MQKPFHEQIKECRMLSKLTLEKAAELLNVSRRSLCDYENGKSRVPDDIALKMSQIYKVPSISYLWIFHCTMCGREILPQVTNRPLSENILDTLAGIENMQKKTPTLIDIGRDGVIDENESSIFKKLITTCFMPIARCMFALSLTSIANKKAVDAGTSTARVKI